MSRRSTFGSIRAPDPARRHRGWQAQLSLGVDPVTGRRRIITRSFDTQREARSWLAEEASKRSRGVTTTPGKRTVGDVCDAWLVSLELRHRTGDLAASTLSWYRAAVEGHLRPGLGHVALVNLDATTIEALYSGKLEGGRVDGTGGLSPRSLRWIHITLSSALSFAVSRRWLERSPMVDVSATPKQPPARKTLDHLWSSDQLARFLEYVADDRLAAAFRVAAVTGCRRGELLGLKWSDLAGERLTIARAYTMIGGSPQISDTKTEASARVVELDTATVAAMKRWKLHQLEERVAWGAGYHDDGWLFTRENGTPLRPDWMTRRFQRLAAKAGLPVIGFHGLRHSTATAMLRRGVGVKIVSELLGHGDISTTLRTYQAIMPGDHRAAVELLAALLDG